MPRRVLLRAACFVIIPYYFIVSDNSCGKAVSLVGRLLLRVMATVTNDAKNLYFNALNANAQDDWRRARKLITQADADECTRLIVFNRIHQVARTERNIKTAVSGFDKALYELVMVIRYNNRSVLKE